MMIASGLWSTWAPFLDPLGAPCRRVKGIAEILCFMHDFAVLEFHDADRVSKASLIRSRVFSYPEITGPENPSDIESCGLAWMIAAESLQILSPRMPGSS